MKSMNLIFDTKELGLKPEAGGDPASAQELSRRVVGFAIAQYTEQRGGLIKQERSQAYWLRKELEKTAATNAATLEMPDDVSGFLRKVFREVKLAADLIIEKVEANVDAIKME
jgi:hypothetical protein